MVYVVVLQNCMGFVEGETGACTETCVMCDVDGTDEVSFKVEEAIDIKDEIPETIPFAPIKTKREVSSQGVCLVVAANAFSPFIATKINCENMLNCFLLCVIMWVPYTF